MILEHKACSYLQTSTAEAFGSRRLAAAFAETGFDAAHRAAADRFPGWRNGTHRAKGRCAQRRRARPVTTAGATAAERP